MKKLAVLLLLNLSLVGSIRVLHLSFHAGCIGDINEVAKELDWNLTTWNPLSSRQSSERFLGPGDHPMGAYNMTHERAARIWAKNRQYFEQFDMVITSDTAPLSRIFIQNGWRKPLIIWVCNRFNYCVGPGSQGGMDREYYQLFEQAVKMPNVCVASYTPFEHYFAALYKVDIRGPIIKPIGTKQGVCAESAIPSGVQKEKTLFVWPGFGGCKKEQLEHIKGQCDQLGYPTYCGRYNGPDDLTDFKGVIYFPYQASNLALFENLQRGIVHFVPSERFIAQLIKEGASIYYWHEPYYCEWYFGVHRDVIVYFDSWQDLKEKIATTDYPAMHAKIKAFGRAHREEMLDAWRGVVERLVNK